MNNKLVVFAGPSGVGKATLEKKIFNDLNLKLEMSISATTRSMRVNEKDGSDYYFMNNNDFINYIENNSFIEWSKHFGNMYGTLKSELERIQDANKIPFLEIDVDGAKNVFKNTKNNNVLSIFICPPSIDDLKKRLELRNTESKVEFDERLKRVDYEMSFSKMFDHVVVNDDAENAAKEVISLINEFLKK